MRQKEMGMDPYSECNCLAARRHARQITRLYDRYLRPYGLRATQFSVLAALAAGQARPISRLADFLGMERTTLTRSVAVLQGRGWIQTDTSPDARVRPLRLTNLGRRKLRAAHSGWIAAQKAAARLRQSNRT